MKELANQTGAHPETFYGKIPGFNGNLKGNVLLTDLAINEKYLDRLFGAGLIDAEIRYVQSLILEFAPKCQTVARLRASLSDINLFDPNDETTKYDKRILATIVGRTSLIMGREGRF